MGQAGPSRAFLSSSSRTHLLLSHAGGHAPWLRAAIWVQELRAIIPSPCLVPDLGTQIPLCKRRFPITLKCRQMYGVLNIDEIKN
jgi:hypothetical protein